ncbi:MAG TPA: PAS domain S-box protein, partial [Pyrinomonadaceae bacterium]|nr:PAS domain S-box protein [Pyrinomonadaceae bacterium]
MAVNAPGNDIFTSRDVAGETRRTGEALAEFKQAFSQARSSLLNDNALGETSVLRAQMANLDGAMQAMVGESNLIFAHFEAQPQRAGEHMAAMDQKFGKVNEIITALQNDLRDLEQQRFVAETETTQRLKRFELLVNGLLVLLVLLVAAYGLKLSRRFTASWREKEGHLAALEINEQRFRELSAASPVGIFQMDAQGNCTYANERFLQIAGLSLDQIVTEGWINAVHPEDRQRVDAAWRAISEGREYESEFRLRNKTAAVHWVNMQANDLRSEVGDLYGFVGTIEEITARKQTEQLTSTQYEITKVLTSTASVREVTPKALRLICENTGWTVGGIWRVDKSAKLLRMVGTWQEPTLGSDEFTTRSRGMTFARGEGMPGRVWAEGKALWIPDVVKDDQFPRAPLAIQDGLHGAGSFPIVFNNEVVGVIEFLSTEVRDFDAVLNAMINAIGFQIGQFFGRRAAEESLQASEKRYRELIENSQGLICTHDMQGVLLTVNQAAASMLGYEPTEMIGKNLSEILAESALPSYHQYLKAVQTQHQTSGFLNLVAKDGTVRVWMFRNSRYEEDGQPPYVMGHAIDITSLKKTEAALAASEEQYRTLAEAATDIILTIDRESTITFINPACETIFGYKPAELTGQKLAALMPERFREAHGNGVARYMSSGVKHLNWNAAEVPGLCKDGTEIDLEISFGEFKRDGLHNFTGIIRDVSERKRTQQELQASQAQLSGIIQSAMDAIITTDAQQKIKLINAAAEKMFRCTAADAIGRSIADFIPQRFRESHEKHLQSYSKTGATERSMGGLGDIFGLRADGEEFPIEASISLVDGAERLHTVIIRDVTERKRAQAEVEAAKDVAEAAARAKSEFLANMSHEIRTPMNAIIGMTGLLLNTTLDRDQEDFVDTIRNSSDSLLTIINDILDFSKIESGKLELEELPFDLRDCIEDSLDLLATKASEKGLDLAYILDRSVPSDIIGDVTRLRQVLVNLFSNAVKFTSKGEVVVSVSSEKMLKSTDLYRLHFAVKDTGIGIPQERMDRLFKSFSQVDASTTRTFGGTGLGLAISKRLVEIMDGKMWVESEVGTGSTFHFTIATTAAPETKKTYLRSAQPQLTGKTLLVVDDNETNRLIVVRQAESWGMLPHAVESGIEALSLLDHGQRFDVAVLDMLMPDMDGFSLAKEIRRRLDERILPLIMLSSVGRREVKDPEAEAAFSEFLTKPIKPSQLFNVLVKVLNGHPVERSRVLPQTSSDRKMAERLPLRILLVEDNAINQKVALRILQLLGYRADLAANGLEAIEALVRQPYDIVFMDMQMPEMGGIEATKCIRQRWPRNDRGLIVAMTANAMQGDKEQCLAAGMDDYISKPVRIDMIQQVLEHWGRQVSSRRAPEMSGSVLDGQVLDAQVLNELRALQDEGDPNILAEMIGMYLEDSPGQVIQIREAIERADAPGLVKSAHGLKGSCASLGARALWSLCDELEQLGLSGDVQSPARLLPSLQTEADRVTSSLNRELT